ncbi:hypothetical protein MMC08_002787 [Hypocenomyce scalaris]|nr:hypothetical protein [Hypocenomyce scalaris]
MDLSALYAISFSCQDSGMDLEDVNISKAVADRPNVTDEVTEKPGEASSPELRDDHLRAAVARIPTAQDWTGLDDPENPMNWPMWTRCYHTIIPALYAFTVSFGSSVYTPGYPEIARQFHVSTTTALLGLSLYVLGLAFGPVLAAPLSETFGRRIIYLSTLPVSALFTLGAGFSKNFAALLVCRLFAGFFGSPSLALGAGTNVDIWPPVHRALSTSLFVLAPFLGPALGPVVGGFAAQYKGWRWTEWPILFAAVGVFVFSFAQKETYKKIILQKRAKRLGIAPPIQKGPTGLRGIKFLLTVTLFRPIHMILTEPIVACFSLYVGFNFSVLFAFFAAFPIVFEGVYGFDPGFSGLTFLAIGVGCIISAGTTFILDRVLYRKEYEKSLGEGRQGLVLPEHRLYAAMLGSFGLPIGLFWFAWTARKDVHWISPVLAAVPFAWGNLCVFLSAALYLADVYGPLNGASALAANGFVRYVSGAAFPLFTVQMYSRLGIAWATSLLGFISLALLPVPWALFKYGPKVRARSGYDTVNFLPG